MFEFLRFISEIYWKIKTHIFFKLYGPYGVSNCVEIMPHSFVIPTLKKYGAKVGEGCNFERGLIIHRPDKRIPFKNLNIRNNVYLGHNLLIDLTDKVIFEDNTAFAADCQIWTHTGDYEKQLRDKNDYHERIGSVKIKEGSVCYSKVIINPGVVIGSCARVYAFSLVNRNIPDFEIWCGIPAKFKKKRDFK